MKIIRRFSLIEREDIVQKSKEFLWTEGAKSALEYLRNRGLSDKTIRAFDLGFLPNDLKHQLRGRIIMPLYDASGHLISITSRLPRTPEESDLLPVYWHEGYEKSFYLYGINLAKKYMRRWGFSIVCEGQFDVMQMYNAEARNTVGLCCHNMTEIQLSTILRYCSIMVLLLDNDPDETGWKAANKIEKKFSETPCQIIKIKLQEYKDPDEYVRKKGIEKLKVDIRKKLADLNPKEAYV